SSEDLPEESIPALDTSIEQSEQVEQKDEEILQEVPKEESLKEEVPKDEILKEGVSKEDVPQDLPEASLTEQSPS
ncbi:hypothetical protein BGX34_008468, partial [Mortierella sp. NVP85]